MSEPRIPGAYLAPGTSSFADFLAAQIGRPAPNPGQHTAEVLRDWLGEGAELTVPDGAADGDAERRRATPGARQ